MLCVCGGVPPSLGREYCVASTALLGRCPWLVLRPLRCLECVRLGHSIYAICPGLRPSAMLCVCVALAISSLSCVPTPAVPSLCARGALRPDFGVRPSVLPFFTLATVKAPFVPIAGRQKNSGLRLSQGVSDQECRQQVTRFGPVGAVAATWWVAG